MVGDSGFQDSYYINLPALMHQGLRFLTIVILVTEIFRVSCFWYSTGYSQKLDEASCLNLDMLLLLY